MKGFPFACLRILKLKNSNIEEGKVSSLPQKKEEKK